MEQSQKSSFLRYLTREIIKQTKESSLITYPFSFGTALFGSARFHWNRSLSGPKSKDSGSKLNGSKGSSVNTRLIRTNFGTVPFGSSGYGAYIIFIIPISLSTSQFEERKRTTVEY